MGFITLTKAMRWIMCSLPPSLVQPWKAYEDTRLDVMTCMRYDEQSGCFVCVGLGSCLGLTGSALGNLVGTDCRCIFLFDTKHSDGLDMPDRRTLPSFSTVCDGLALGSRPGTKSTGRFSSECTYPAIRSLVDGSPTMDMSPSHAQY